MKLRTALAVASLAPGLLVLGACSSSEEPRAAQVEPPPVGWHFEAPLGALPAGWRSGTTNAASGQAGARWEVRAEQGAPSAPAVLALVDARGQRGDTYNLCWYPATSLADLELELSLRAEGGREDQGGGPAWRIAGVDDYYLARWNPLEDNFRLYSVQAGVRRMLADAPVAADASAWHRIRVRQIGASITCWFDEEPLLQAQDSRLSAPGAVGLWTKADAATAFDELSVKAQP